MITCPNCQAEELSGTLFCSECGAQLIYPSADERSTVLKESDTLENSVESTVPTTPLYKDPPKEDFALYLIEEEIFLTSPQKDEILVGRKYPNQPTGPDIDLSEHKGYNKGVSRVHAKIIRENSSFGTYHILDLNSSNGTRVNGNPIPINSAVPIHHNDILTLGKMKIQVIISQK